MNSQKLTPCLRPLPCLIIFFNFFFDFLASFLADLVVSNFWISIFDTLSNQFRKKWNHNLQSWIFFSCQKPKIGRKREILDLFEWILDSDVLIAWNGWLWWFWRRYFGWPEHRQLWELARLVSIKNPYKKRFFQKMEKKRWTNYSKRINQSQKRKD